MKRYLFVFGILVLGAAGLVFALQGGRAKAAREPFVHGEALVKFKSGVTDTQASRLISSVGAKVKERIDPQRIYVVTFSKSIQPPEMVGRFQRMPEVAYAEPNLIVQALFLDWLAPQELWAEQTPKPLGAGAKVTVAVIDTAIDSNHSVLAGKMVTGYNFLDNTTNTQSAGVGKDWHGTASTGRVLDGAGDANIQIMPLTVLASSGSGSIATLVKAINYAVDQKVEVINMSLGWSGTFSPSVQEALNRAQDAGIVVVAAAGNTGREDARYPAAMDGVISVAATNEAGKKAGFSTYHETVDLSAPGDTQRLLSHGGYRISQGTSFAAPFIAGLAAMLKSAFPALKALEIENLMKSRAHAVDTLNPSFAGKLGAGFLNALDVKRWMEEIRAGTFLKGQPPAPQPVPVPPPGPRPTPAPTQPWLVRGKGNSGNILVTPTGDVVQESKP